MVIPDNVDYRNKILRELDFALYSEHLGVRRTLARVRKGFYWKRQIRDVRISVDSSSVCQVKKSNHTLTRGQLQNNQILEARW